MQWIPDIPASTVETDTFLCRQASAGLYEAIVFVKRGFKSDTRFAAPVSCGTQAC